MQIIYCVGNPDIPDDAVALDVAKYFQQHPYLLSGYSFEILKHPEILINTLGSITLMDVVKGIREVTLLHDKDLGRLRKRTITTMHDFDLGALLQIMREAGTLESVRIVAIPMGMGKEEASKELQTMLGAMHKVGQSQRLPIQIQSIVFRKKTVSKQESSNSSWEFLIMKRLPERGGFWQFITGGLESDDPTKEACAVREAMEEAGIERKDILKVHPNVHTFSFRAKGFSFSKGKEIDVDEFAFGIEISPDVKVTLEKNVYPEHSEYRWVPAQDARRLLKWRSSKDALGKLLLLLKEEKR